LIPLKVSIVGAGRKRNGIGEYIGKYFHKHGAAVTSVLGTTEKTSLETSAALRKYGMETRAYTDFDAMVSVEKTDAVVIASPSSTHYGYLLKCLDRGLHIFCEKPFIWGDEGDVLKKVEDFFEKARGKKITIAMNSQWPFSVGSYEEMCGKIRPEETNNFFVQMSPYSPGKTMIPESVPHPLSILYCRLGAGDIRDLSLEWDGEGEMGIRFIYQFGTGACRVLIRLISQKTQPREFSFGFNDRVAFRTVGPEDYQIYFTYGTKKMRIQDPLELSVKNFLEAVENKTEPLIGCAHILHNMSLLREIYDGFDEIGKRGSWKS